MHRYITVAAALAAWLSAASGGPAAAAVTSRAGDYRIELATDPSVVPVGQARLLIRVQDRSAAPMNEAAVTAIAQMPGMPMGERETVAAPLPGQRGVYTLDVRFPMEGGYAVTVRVNGASAAIPLRTGQDTGTLSGVPSSGIGPVVSILPWLGAAAVFAFVAYRMRRTGQRIAWRALLRPSTLLGIAVLTASYLASAWAVNRFTQPGHMSVIEAQAMDMSAMKPPVGAVPVAAMAAKREPISSTVSYSGSAVAFVDQDVAARVPGTIVAMTAYPGDRVRRGQVIARLDTSELGSRVAEQSANATMADHEVEIARIQAKQAVAAVDQARAQVHEAQSELASARADVAGARQDAAAASDEHTAAQAELDTARSAVDGANAELKADLADQRYWQAQLKRSTLLLTDGVISKQAFDRDRDEAESADARVAQARARIDQSAGAVRAAQSRLAKAGVMAASAAAKLQALSEKALSAAARVSEATANARSMANAADAARHLVEHRQAGQELAMAQLHTQSVIQGYTEVRAEVDGLVMQRLLSPGQLVQPGQAILRVSQVAPIRLQANVSQEDLADIHIGAPVRAWSTRDRSRPATMRVTSVFPSADPTAHTSVVEALYDNRDHRFVPGDYVTLEINTHRAQSALVVPASAIVHQALATSAVQASAISAAVWTMVAGVPQTRVYTCSMHSAVKSDRPGKCPT